MLYHVIGHVPMSLLIGIKKLNYNIYKSFLLNYCNIVKEMASLI